MNSQLGLVEFLSTWTPEFSNYWSARASIISELKTNASIEFPTKYASATMIKFMLRKEMLKWVPNFENYRDESII